MMVALDAGADDIVADGDMWQITTGTSELNTVRDALTDAEIPVESADLSMVPTSTVEVTDPGVAKQVLRLMELIDDLDDVQDVHGNFDISDELMESVVG